MGSGGHLGSSPKATGAARLHRRGSGGHTLSTGRGDDRCDALRSVVVAEHDRCCTSTYAVTASLPISLSLIHIFLCFFLRMRLRRFLINEPMRCRRLAGPGDASANRPGRDCACARFGALGCTSCSRRETSLPGPPFGDATSTARTTGSVELCSNHSAPRVNELSLIHI